MPPPPRAGAGGSMTTFDKLKMGAMMGSSVGLIIGFLFGGVNIVRFGAGPNGLMRTLGQYMLGSAATFGVLAEIEGRPDELMVTTKTGFSIFNTGSGELREVKRVLSDERSAARLRFNDGAVDAKGRFWAGTMTDFHIGEDIGTLWRLDPNLSLHRMIDNITVPNGIGWSPDNETMYFADSAPKIVWAYDFDLSSGSISNRRIFYEHDGRPNPDGLCIDSNGGIWLALWEGNRVINISPTGEVMREIVLPAWRVTCPVFGGVEFDELFITTATHDLKSYVEGSKVDGMRDFGGSVFRVHVGIKGLRKNKFVSEV
ncbi:MAG: hypothetical protein M1827_007330 [Pycnora praestabilis]|nr:MAG: hypothetical protein M1827_007330 [Pycnora praestabilis]